jgi:hypothetical protein
MRCYGRAARRARLTTRSGYPEQNPAEPLGIEPAPPRRGRKSGWDLGWIDRGRLFRRQHDRVCRLRGRGRDPVTGVNWPRHYRVRRVRWRRRYPIAGIDQDLPDPVNRHLGGLAFTVGHSADNCDLLSHFTFSCVFPVDLASLVPRVGSKDINVLNT